MQERMQEGEKHSFLYAWVEYYLQPVICRSRGGLSANEKKEKFA